MSETIMVKPGELSARMLKKAISSLEKANDTLISLSYMRSYGRLADVYYFCKGSSYRLFSNSTVGLIPADVQFELDKLLSYSSVLDTCPERFEKIDKSFKTSIKKWRRSGKHNQILWQTSNGSGTAGETDINTSKGGTPTIKKYDEWDSNSKGTIRHVYQLGDYEKNGWGRYNTEHKTPTGTTPRNECGTAGQSMALSYIGIDAPPETIIDNGRGVTYWGYGDASKYGYNVDVHPDSTVNNDEIYHSGAEYKERMDKMFTAYQNDSTCSTSPVVIHYRNGGNEHTLVVIDKNEQGYIVVDPAQKSEQYIITISEDGQIQSGEKDYVLSHGGGTMDGVIQYSLPESGK